MKKFILGLIFILLTDLVFALTADRVLPVIPIVDGLVSWWKFDDATGSSAVDSRSVNDGTFCGLPIWISTGMINYALQFTRHTSDYIDCGAGTNLQNLTQKSIFAWFKAPAFTGEFRTIYHHGYLGVNSGDYFYLDDDINRIYLRTRNTLLTDAVVTINFTPNEWTHVGITWDGQNVVFYKDGIYDSHVGLTGTVASTSSNLNIGVDSNLYFLGYIDEVMVYNRGLTLEEVFHNYQFRKGRVLARSRQLLRVRQLSKER